jgi:hypothetical protein
MLKINGEYQKLYDRMGFKLKRFPEKFISGTLLKTKGGSEEKNT